MNLSTSTKLTKVLAGAVSAGTAQNTASVDMANWHGVLFFGSIATADAGNSANAAQSADDTTFADLAGTKVVTGDDADSWLIDVIRPTDRYVRAEVVRAGADTVTGDVYALQYGPAVKPTTHGATIDSELHVDPVEGTA